MGHSDTQLATGVKWFTDRLDAVTTASPTTHKLGTSSSIREFPLAKGSTSTAASLFKQLRAGGVRIIPILYNDESAYTTLLPKLRALFASPGAVIKQLVDLANAHDLDGWNLDLCVIRQTKPGHPFPHIRFINTHTPTGTVGQGFFVSSECHK
jgi:hypothetical protein